MLDVRAFPRRPAAVLVAVAMLVGGCAASVRVAAGGTHNGAATVVARSPRATVRGHVVADPSRVWLCTALAQSLPPRCGGRSLVVVGVDPGRLPALRRRAGVFWNDREIVLRASLAGGVLDVDANRR